MLNNKGISKRLLIKRSLNFVCLNGGFQPKAGLPCVCPKDFSGNQCEFSFSKNLSNSGLCLFNSCKNNGVIYQTFVILIWCQINKAKNEKTCVQNSNLSGFRCNCKLNYYGPRCDYYKCNLNL